ncbi:MAG: triose-phosphate isomerase [Oscillatoriales cyanobacterium SM2_1_8]|nr:triose-phosphate isomerase [Oscillatoriales cyanobacterium SM2_1_8]
MRSTTIAGNWKMHKTQAEAKAFLQAFAPLWQPQAGVDVVLCAPFTALAMLSGAIAATGLPVSLGAQNVHWAETGAFTGEIAPGMLVELGIRYVVVGHSERRQFFGETDATVNQRVRAAQAHGLTPILCVGETKVLRAQGQVESWIFDQLDRALADTTALPVIAYEPIWAIGTGDTCAPTEANRVLQSIRHHLGDRGAEATLLYGGSVKGNNIAEILTQPEIDGVLVGGASLDPEEFAQIANAAQP